MILRGPTVWLDVSLAEARRRRPADPTRRPLWTDGDDPTGFRALYERRRAVYALAPLRVPADGSPEQVADAVERLL